MHILFKIMIIFQVTCLSIFNFHSCATACSVYTNKSCVVYMYNTNCWYTLLKNCCWSYEIMARLNKCLHNKYTRPYLMVFNDHRSVVIIIVFKTTLINSCTWSVRMQLSTWFTSFNENHWVVSFMVYTCFLITLFQSGARGLQQYNDPLIMKD